MKAIRSIGPEKPDGAATIRNYARFAETLDAFASKVNDPKGFKFLLIIGKGGKGKTEMVDAALRKFGYHRNDDTNDKGYGYANGKMTAIALHRFLHQWKDKPIVLDDINSLLKHSDTPSLIQAATETRLPRTITYNSDNKSLGDDEGQVPKSFKSSSPIIIIANEWGSVNHIVKSIETRAYSIYFDPSNTEVHNAYVAEWFGKNAEEKEVYKYIGDLVEDVPSLHCRHYVNGRLLKYNRPNDWREELLSILVPDNQYAEFFVRRLLKDKRYKTDVQRIKEFVDRGIGSPITFKRIKDSLGMSKPQRTTLRYDLDTLRASLGQDTVKAD